jgi:hypothetical protein
MKSEMKINELKSNFWREVSKKRIAPETEYDSENDTFFFYFADPGKGIIITHYLDKNVALLFRASDNEIVGFCIEGFERSFSSKYANKQAWQLSKTGIVIEGIKEFKFGIMREHDTYFNLPVKNIRIERDIKLNPEYAFA